MPSFDDQQYQLVLEKMEQLLTQGSTLDYSGARNDKGELVNELSEDAVAFSFSGAFIRAVNSLKLPLDTTLDPFAIASVCDIIKTLTTCLDSPEILLETIRKCRQHRNVITNNTDSPIIDLI